MSQVVLEILLRKYYYLGTTILLFVKNKDGEIFMNRIGHVHQIHIRKNSFDYILEARVDLIDYLFGSGGIVRQDNVRAIICFGFYYITF